MSSVFRALSASLPLLIVFYAFSQLVPPVDLGYFDIRLQEGYDHILTKLPNGTDDVTPRLLKNQIDDVSTTGPELIENIGFNQNNGHNLSKTIFPAIQKLSGWEEMVAMKEVCAPMAVPSSALSKEVRLVEEMCSSQNFTRLLQWYYSIFEILPRRPHTGSMASSTDPVWQFRLDLLKRQLCKPVCEPRAEVFHFSQTRSPYGYRGLGARICHMIAGFGCALSKPRGSLVIGDASRGSLWQWAFTDLKACPDGGHHCYFRNPHRCSGQRARKILENGAQDMTRQRGMCDFAKMHRGMDRMRASSELVFFLMQPNSAILRQIKRLKEYLSWDSLPRPILAMHVRHGKMRHEGSYIRFERFMELAAAARDREGREFKTIFLFTDDLEVMQQAATSKSWQERWTMVSMDYPKFAQKGWDESIVDAGGDAFLAILGGTLNGCHTGALTILNLYFASMCDGFIGTFNSNMDRLVARLIHAQYPVQYEMPPILSLDAWPCGFFDVVCAPQVRIEFPGAVAFDPSAAEERRARNTALENQRWWEENFKNFTGEWFRRYPERLSTPQLLSSPPVLPVMIHEPLSGQKRRELIQSYLRGLKEAGEKRRNASVFHVHLHAEAASLAPIRLGQISERWARAAANLQPADFPRLQITGWPGLAGIPVERGQVRYMLVERPEGVSLSEISHPQEAVEGLGDGWRESLNPLTGELREEEERLKAAAVATTLFNATKAMGTHLMEILSLSNWPYPQLPPLTADPRHPTTKPMLAVALPRKNPTTSADFTLDTVLKACKQLQAGSVYLSTPDNSEPLPDRQTWRKRLREAGVILVTFETKSLQGIGDWKHPSVAIYSDILAMSMADAFIGDPGSASDRLVYHLINARAALLALPAPRAMYLSGDALRPF